MKFTHILSLATAALATPTPTINHPSKRDLSKRATVTDSCPIGFASGTTGGAGGTTTTVSSLPALTSAAKADGPAVIVVSGSLTGPGKVKISSDKTVIGASGGASLTNIALNVKDADNVVVRNLKIGQVDADNGDAVGIDASTNVWVDHCDLSGSLAVDKDTYDGLFDVKHGADMVTISNTFLHDAWKASLIGHSDSNADEDTGKLHVTYANNRWEAVNSRAPSVRFGTVHIINQDYTDIQSSGVNTRLGAQVLIESTAFTGTKKPVVAEYSDETGFAVLNDVELGGGENSAPKGTLKGADLPYKYDLVGSGGVAKAVAGAGANLVF